MEELPLDQHFRSFSLEKWFWGAVSERKMRAGRAGRAGILHHLTTTPQTDAQEVSIALSGFIPVGGACI